MGSARGPFAGKIYPADVGQLPPAHIWKDHPRGPPLLARMLRVHYRDGGKFLSVIVAKYYIAS